MDLGSMFCIRPIRSNNHQLASYLLTGSPASPRPKPPLAFHTQFFSFSRLSESLEQAKKIWIIMFNINFGYVGRFDHTNKGLTIFLLISV